MAKHVHAGRLNRGRPAIEEQLGGLAQIVGDYAADSGERLEEGFNALELDGKRVELGI